MEDEKLRLELVKQAGFSLAEVPLVYRFVKGDEQALDNLKELQDFQEWKEEKSIKEAINPSQQEGS